MSRLTQEQFLAEVSGHKMTVLRDDGVYRHVRFARPGTMCMHFDLVTWPGYLAYTGDMGTYVFSRLDDMFEFFRTDRRDSSTLKINRSYWSEKLQHGPNGGRDLSQEFSAERFAEVVKENFRNWMRDNYKKTTKEQRRELWDALSELIEAADGDRDGAHSLNEAYGFRYEDGDCKFTFVDLFEHTFTECTHHFTWCCYAIAWGILQYDLAASKGGQL